MNNTELPPLPEALNDILPMDLHYDVYTADQMRDYARAALASQASKGAGINSRFCDHCGMPKILHNRECVKVADTFPTYTFGDGFIYYRKDDIDASPSPAAESKQAAVPEGWVLVPRKMTDEQARKVVYNINRKYKISGPLSDFLVRQIWEWAIYAKPSVPVQEFSLNSALPALPDPALEMTDLYDAGQMRSYALNTVQQYQDAYNGAREDIEIWKRRALEAEESCRKMSAALNESNGPLFMGEPTNAAPSSAQPAPVADGLAECDKCDGHGATHYLDGEWKGKCTACKGTGIAQAQAQPPADAAPVEAKPIGLSRSQIDEIARNVMQSKQRAFFMRQVDNMLEAK